MGNTCNTDVSCALDSSPYAVIGFEADPDVVSSCFNCKDVPRNAMRMLTWLFLVRQAGIGVRHPKTTGFTTFVMSVTDLAVSVC
jgi:hypothetical protein